MLASIFQLSFNIACYRFTHVYALGSTLNTNDVGQAIKCGLEHSRKTINMALSGKFPVGGESAYGKHWHGPRYEYHKNTIMIVYKQ